MQAFEQFSLADFQFLAEKSEGIVCRFLQYIAHGEEVRFLLVDDTAVRRDAYLTVGERIERIQCLVRRYAWSQMHEDFHLGRSQVFHFANFDFSLFAGFYDRVAYTCDGLSERDFGYGECLVVHLVYLGSDFHHTTTFAVVVAGYINGTTGLEVRIELEFLLA